MADALAPDDAVVSGIAAMRRVKYVSPRPSMLPFLVWEYGLGELTPYVPNLYDLIDQGVRWQRVRGTVSAVAIGLAWIGYTAEIEEAWTGRRWWNSFQLRFPTLPASDTPDLERIEGITSLSVPKRSQLRRGVHQYDVGAVEADHAMLDGSMLNSESGIAVTQAGTIWSFGRVHEFEYLLNEADGTAIGNWVEPPTDADLQFSTGSWLDPAEDVGALPWSDLTMLWVDADFLWSGSDAAEIRRTLMAGWFAGKPIYARLSSVDGVIGYRRCRAVRPVVRQFEGAYAFGDDRYEPKASGGILYAEALTQFDDADNVTCTEVALVIGGALTLGVKPGRLWLSPDDLVGGVAIARQNVGIPLRRTVREQLKFLMRF